MGDFWRTVFGAKAQVVVGVACALLGAAAWAYGTAFVYPLTLPPDKVAFVFHVSMFFGEVACYAIVATGLGYRATERVEAKVDEADIQARRAEVEADDVEVTER